MAERPWQLELVKYSLKKKEKVDLIRRHVRPRPADRLLDLGCAQGILSHFLRRRGGWWVSTDLDMTNLRSSQALLGTNLVRMGVPALPFRSRAFDGVVCLDYLEHVEDDEGTLAEIRRVLKPGGTLLLITPHTGPFFMLQKIRPLVGLKLEFYGHKREGYSLADLRAKLGRSGLRLAGATTYARFFTELLELVLNGLYVNVLSTKPQNKLRDGHIRPSTADEFAGQKNAFRLYKLVYPVFWLASRLDSLLFFQRGNAVMVEAVRVE
ncbi:MAG: class I SAM-dependent methyltransferase [Candidatus Aminicenantes bacterium]|nr:class I SAM-dependent methyltransferase [Candidatus Aminicenantes bacterium]